MAERNEHLIVIMLEPLPQNEEFEAWPPHVTIVPWFPCNNGRQLDKTLSQIASRHKPFKVTMGEIADWGREDKFKVIILNDEGQLADLHLDVFHTLENNGFPIHQKDYLGDKYVSHITLRNYLAKEVDYRQGMEIIVKEFSLIKQIRLKGSGRMIKSLVRNYELG